MFRHALTQAVSCSGVGIHSGKPCTLGFLPAPIGSGIVFVRTDLNFAEVPVVPASIASTNRATLLKHQDVFIQTPEHVLAACWALGLTDVRIEVSAQEMPIMDGSSDFFVKMLQEGQIKPSDRLLEEVTINTHHTLQLNGQSLILLPDESFKLTYIADYSSTFIGLQSAHFNGKPDYFVNELAHARTYGFKAEVEQLLKQGLALGGSLDNALVIDETDYVQPPRYENEIARHKVLDMIGDLAILGKRIKGHVIGVKSGHALNMQAVNYLDKLFWAL